MQVRNRRGNHGVYGRRPVMALILVITLCYSLWRAAGDVSFGKPLLVLWCCVFGLAFSPGSGVKTVAGIYLGPC
jgi:hypothetical protein